MNYKIFKDMEIMWIKYKNEVIKQSKRIMKTVFPPTPYFTYNEWIRYIHNEVMKQKKFKNGK